MAPLDAISQVCGKLHCFLQHARLASVLQDASADFLNPLEKRLVRRLRRRCGRRRGCEHIPDRTSARDGPTWHRWGSRQHIGQPTRRRRRDAPPWTTP